PEVWQWQRRRRRRRQAQDRLRSCRREDGDRELRGAGRRVTPSTWVIAFEVPKAAGAIFADAIGELAGNHSCFETADRDRWRFEGFVETAPERAAISLKLSLVAAAAGVAAPDVAIARLAPSDWLAENRKQFPPTAIGRFFVYGAYFEGRVPAGSVAIALDAGLAFGSGTHESTR